MCAKRVVFVMLFILSFVGLQAAASELKIASLPKSESVCSDYEVFVNGQAVPVYSCRVSAFPINQTWPGYQRPLDQTELAGFAYWEMSNPVEIEIVTKRVATTVAVRPLSLGIKPRTENHRISFKLEKATPIVVEVNDYHHALHLFPGEPRTPPQDKQKEGFYYFGPGVHDIGVMTLKDHDSVYIDSGAVVYGAFLGKNVSDIRIEGPGIVDGSKFDRAKSPNNIIRFTGCKNVHIDGPILRDPSVWAVILTDCDNVNVKNLRLVGLWRYNADGIDVCNCRDVVVENCFVRAFDDALVVKGLPRYRTKPSRNVIFRRCTVWCDWGRALEIGAETCAPEISNVLFEDCDVIRTTHIALDIQHYDEAQIKHVRFENIRVELDDWIPQGLFQRKKDEKYVVNKKDNYCPQLMVVVIPKWRAPWSTEKRGTAKDIVFKDITIYSSRMPPSLFAGYSKEHNVDGVLVEKVRMAGQDSGKNAKALNLHIPSFVDNVTITP